MAPATAVGMGVDASAFAAFSLSSRSALGVAGWPGSAGIPSAMRSPSSPRCSAPYARYFRRSSRAGGSPSGSGRCS
jgi:hypothetical protein